MAGRIQPALYQSIAVANCCYSCVGWSDKRLALRHASMPYHVISFTMTQVRQGSLGWQRQLGTILREHPAVKVYSPSPFDLDERRRMKERFGGDIVYFFNEAASEAADQMGLELRFLATISDEELPRRRSLVVGLPERLTDGPMKRE